MNSMETEHGPNARVVILVVDDDSAKRDALKAVLEPDFSVYTAASGREAIELLKGLGRVNALIAGQSLPDLKGTTLIRYVNETVEKSEAIVKMLISDSGEQAQVADGPFASRIDFHYDQPFDPNLIRQKIRYLIAQKSQEKRRTMRTAFFADDRIAADTGLCGKAVVKNIGEDGMFIKAILPHNYLLPFKVILPDGQELLAAGRVVRIDEEIGGVGIKFLLIEEESRKALVHFLSDHVLLNNLSDLKEKYPFLRVDKIIAFTDKEKIDSLIAEAIRSRTEITAIHSTLKTPVALTLKDVVAGLFCRFTGEDLSAKFKTSDTLFISFQVGYATYNFETVVYRIHPGGSQLDCLYPRLLFYSEKRSLRRAAADGCIEVEISLPEPFGATMRGTIIDISEGGVSFVTEARDIALLVGTPLESIRILSEEKLVREVRGEVRNILKVDKHATGHLRYGVQFGIGRLTIHASKTPKPDKNRDNHGTPDAERLRFGPRRQSDLSSLAKRPPQVIRLENKNGEEIVGLLDTSLPLERDSVPVVIIPPAFGKTKETLFALAETIIENFYTRGKPIAVIRYDGIRRKGESYKDPEALEPPYEMINACLSQGGEDIKAILDWIDMNPHLRASVVIIVTFSLAALEARVVLRDKEYRRKIHYWISCMGTPELRHLLTRVNCGLDLLEQYLLGIKLGVLPVLGNLVNVDKYMEDAVSHRIATLDQARDDMKLIDIPITWLYGEHDHWVKPEFVRDVMGINADAPREVVSMPLGHNARTSEDALNMFGGITSLIHRFLFRDTIRPFMPLKSNLEFKRLAEKDRIPARTLKNRSEYWRRYLVGEKELIGFDVLILADDYRQLMHDQLEALELSSGDRLLDLGGGTGNFIKVLLESGRPLPGHITIADLVPEAIGQAMAKLRPLIEAGQKSVCFDSVACDIEMNRYRPVARFLRGEVAGFKELVDKIENLTVQTAGRIEEMYSPRLHRILRGKFITPTLNEWLRRTFELPEIRTILDFNQAARLVQGLDEQVPQFRQLVFPKDLKKNLYLPVKAGYYNKILMSLVLSYIFNPLETLRELKRILASGGYLVLSSLHPDADASGLFTRLAEKVDCMKEEEFPSGWDKQIVLSSIRSFLNDAQALVELEEAGTFDFFDRDKLDGLIEEAGFEVVRTIETFGDPPQGYILVAKSRNFDG